MTDVTLTPKKMGRPKKYNTDDERKAALRERYLRKTEGTTTRRNKQHETKDDYLDAVKEYRRGYIKTRYAEDEKFREYVRAHSRASYQKKKQTGETA